MKFYRTYDAASYLSYIAALGWLLTGIFFMLNAEAEEFAGQPEAYWTFLSENPNAAIYRNLENASLLITGIGSIGVIVSYRSLLHAYQFTNDLAAVCGIIGFTLIMINAASIIGYTDHYIFIFNQSEMGKAIVSAQADVPLDSKGILTYGMLSIWLILINRLHNQERNIPRLLAGIGTTAGVLILFAPIGMLFDINEFYFISIGIGAMLLLPIWLIWSGIFFGSIEPASDFE
jgi:hypothetical protein